MENELKKLTVYSFSNTGIIDGIKAVIRAISNDKVMVAWREDPDAIQYRLELYLNLKKDFLPLKLCTITKSKDICYHTFTDLTTLSMNGEGYFFTHVLKEDMPGFISERAIGDLFYECIVSAEDIDGNIISQGSTKINLDRYASKYI